MGEMSGLEMILAGCAVFGGVLFFIRTALLVMGFVGGGVGDGDAGDVDVGDVDVGDVDIGDVDAAGADVEQATDTDTDFQILTLQGLSGFFMMFGLIGLAVARGMAKSPIASVVALGAGLAAGLFAVWVITKLFVMMKGFQSSGTLDMMNAIGQDGTVYLRIPADGRGKVQITIQEHLKIFDAASEGSEEMKTGDRVIVTRVVSGNVLLVTKV